METGCRWGLFLLKSSTISLVLEVFSCRWLHLHHPTKSSTRLLYSVYCPSATHLTMAVSSEYLHVTELCMSHALLTEHVLKNEESSPNMAVPEDKTSHVSCSSSKMWGHKVQDTVTEYFKYYFIYILQILHLIKEK